MWNMSILRLPGYIPTGQAFFSADYQALMTAAAGMKNLGAV